jgi:arylsulfatase A-like enzyme
VIHSYAGGKIEDTGPLTKKRMEVVDADILAAAEDFIGRAHQARKPFFVWFNTTRMHIWTHLATRPSRSISTDTTFCLTSRVRRRNRRARNYFNDDGHLVALRYGRWKLVFEEQRTHGIDVWQDPFVTLRFPKLFDMLGDPLERVDHDSIDYSHWRIKRVFLLVPAQAYVASFLQGFKEFPLRQKPATFNLDAVMQSLQDGGNGLPSN